MGKVRDLTAREIADRQFVAWRRLKRTALGVMNDHPAVNLRAAVLKAAEENLGYLERAMKGHSDAYNG